MVDKPFVVAPCLIQSMSAAKQASPLLASQSQWDGRAVALCPGSQEPFGAQPALLL